MTIKKIYLAGPFFTPKERGFILQVADFLRKKYDVFVPMEHFVEGGEMMSNNEWGKAVFDMDVYAMQDADFAVICDYGYTSDAGTAWEAGYLYALNKPTFIISASFETSPTHSLMMVNGCSRFFSSYKEFQDFISCKECVSEKKILQK